MNLAHRHLTDDMFENVLMPAFNSAQQYFKTERKTKRAAAVKVMIDTGLDEAPQVEITSTSKNESAVLAPLQRAVERLKALRQLDAGWDSYSALALDRQAIRPALELVLRSIHRCAEPNINANASGGIDLIWEKVGRALEINVDGQGLFDCLLVVDEEEQEFENFTIDEATTLLQRFCQL